jgi:putative component of membrane protein insertase Oxa1/YidC/SpoIIIJ protein YidD
MEKYISLEWIFLSVAIVGSTLTVPKSNACSYQGTCSTLAFQSIMKLNEYLVPYMVIV